MALLPKVKLKTLVSFPAAVYGGVGIAVRQQNGNYYFDLNYAEFMPPSAIPTADLPNTNVLTYNIARQTYTLAPYGAGSGGRSVLSANTTYYVRQDGNDANNGLSDSPGGAFLTVKHALDVVAGLDCLTFIPTVQIDAGTWTVPIALPKVLCAGTPILTGVGSSTIISTTNADAITNDGDFTWQVNSLKLLTAGPTIASSQLVARNGGNIKFNSIEFGQALTYQAIAFPGSTIAATSAAGAPSAGAFSVSGGSSNGYGFMALGGYMNLVNAVVTYSGAPAYPNGNFAASSCGHMDANGMTFGGTFASVTGVRYLCQLLSMIYTGSGSLGAGSPTYFPGSVNGTPTTGSVYS